MQVRAEDEGDDEVEHGTGPASPLRRRSSGSFLDPVAMDYRYMLRPLKSGVEEQKKEPLATAILRVAEVLRWPRPPTPPPSSAPSFPREHVAPQFELILLTGASAALPAMDGRRIVSSHQSAPAPASSSASSTSEAAATPEASVRGDETTPASASSATTEAGQSVPLLQRGAFAVAARLHNCAIVATPDALLGVSRFFAVEPTHTLDACPGLRLRPRVASLCGVTALHAILQLPVALDLRMSGDVVVELPNAPALQLLDGAAATAQQRALCALRDGLPESAVRAWRPATSAQDRAAAHKHASRHRPSGKQGDGEDDTTSSPALDLGHVPGSIVLCGGAVALSFRHEAALTLSGSPHSQKEAIVAPLLAAMRAGAPMACGEIGAVTRRVELRAAARHVRCAVRKWSRWSESGSQFQNKARSGDSHRDSHAAQSSSPSPLSGFTSQLPSRGSSPQLLRPTLVAVTSEVASRLSLAIAASTRRGLDLSSLDAPGRSARHHYSGGLAAAPTKETRQLRITLGDVDAALTLGDFRVVASIAQLWQRSLERLGASPAFAATAATAADAHLAAEDSARPRETRSSSTPRLNLARSIQSRISDASVRSAASALRFSEPLVCARCGFGNGAGVVEGACAVCALAYRGAALAVPGDDGDDAVARAASSRFLRAMRNLRRQCAHGSTPSGDFVFALPSASALRAAGLSWWRCLSCGLVSPFADRTCALCGSGRGGGVLVRDLNTVAALTRRALADDLSATSREFHFILSIYHMTEFFTNIIIL